MEPFSEAELAFLEGAQVPGRLAFVDPDGTPRVLPVEWSVSGDQQTIELWRPDPSEVPPVELPRVDAVALLVDVVPASGRSRGLELTGPVERLPGPRLARLRPTRRTSWGFDQASAAATGARLPPAHAAPERGTHAGRSESGPMIAVVRRSSYDPDALARSRDRMARFERLHAAQPGYAGNVVVDLGDGERFLVTLWASQAQADSAREALTPAVRELVQPIERVPSRLLGVGPVVTTDLTLARAAHPGEEHGRSPGGDPG